MRAGPVTGDEGGFGRHSLPRVEAGLELGNDRLGSLSVAEWRIAMGLETVKTFAKCGGPRGGSTIWCSHRAGPHRHCHSSRAPPKVGLKTSVDILPTPGPLAQGTARCLSKPEKCQICIGTSTNLGAPTYDFDELAPHCEQNSRRAVRVR